MKFFTMLSLTCAVGILIAFLYDNPRDARVPGNTGPGPATASTPASSAWLSAEKSTTTSSSLSTDSSASNVFSSILALVKRGVSTATGKRTSWQRSELRIARGTVVDQLDTGLVLNCSGWIVKSATRPGVYAGDGRGMNALYANLVDAHEQFQYGRLLTVDRDNVRQSLYDPAMWTPDSYLNGPVLLEGYPPRSPGRGKGFKVVVAPDDEATWQGNSIPAYTASFTLEK